MKKIDVLYKLLGLLLKVHRETKNEDIDKACAMVGYLIDNHWEKMKKVGTSQTTSQLAK